jgi:hypothetical protein
MATTKNSELTVRIPAGTQLLEDNAAYTNRFEIHSSSGDDVYVVSQSKSGRWWSCGCFGWIRHKHCHHLKELGIPCGPKGGLEYYQPYEARLTAGR